METTAPTYYTLAELFYQRTVALAFGWDEMIDVLDFEIELQASFEQTGFISIRPFDWAVD